MFHHTYQGNQNDITTFKQVYANLVARLKTIAKELTDITFKMLDEEKDGSFPFPVVTVSKQLKEGQIRGIHQHLEKKYKVLEQFKQQIERPKRRKHFDEEDIKERLNKWVSEFYLPSRC